MAAKAMLAFLVTAALLLSFCLEVVAERPLPAPSPVSDNLDRTITATKEMAQDVVNSTATKAGEAAQAVKDTANSTVDSITPTVNAASDTVKDATESAKERTGARASWFKHRLGNLGIIRRGPAEPVKLPLSKSPASAPGKMLQTP